MADDLAAMLDSLDGDASRIEEKAQGVERNALGRIDGLEGRLTALADRMEARFSQFEAAAEQREKDAVARHDAQEEAARDAHAEREAEAIARQRQAEETLSRVVATVKRMADAAERAVDVRKTYAGDGPAASAQRGPTAVEIGRITADLADLRGRIGEIDAFAGPAPKPVGPAVLPADTRALDDLPVSQSALDAAMEIGGRFAGWMPGVIERDGVKLLTAGPSHDELLDMNAQMIREHGAGIAGLPTGGHADGHLDPSGTLPASASAVALLWLVVGSIKAQLDAVAMERDERHAG